jgi:hypothetical protein
VLHYLSTLPYRTNIPVPNPKAPNSKDVVNKGNDLSDWLAHRGGTFWAIVVILVVALVVTSLLKRPFVRGIVIGGIILAIIFAVLNGGR